MVKMQVVYEGDLHTSVRHLPSQKKIVTDAPFDNGGKGEAFSPTDLVGAALGSCIATVLGLYAERKKIDLKGMQIDIEKEMSNGPPRRIAKLMIDVWIPTQLTDEEKKKMEHVASSCPVHHSLHPDVEQRIIFHWKE